MSNHQLARQPAKTCSVHSSKAPPANQAITEFTTQCDYIDSDDSDPGTPSQRRLLLLKAAYLLALLLFSLLSTAAVVFSVTSECSAKHDPSRASSPSCPASGAAFALLFAYHFVFALLLLAADSGSGLAALTAFVYLSVVWHLASVVSVLEDYKGLDAMRKSKALIQGKLWTAAAIFFVLNLVFVVVEVAFRAWVVHGASHGVCAVVMLALVVQTVLYVPLKASDVQMEQLHV